MRSLVICTTALIMAAVPAAARYVERADATVLLRIDRLQARVDAALQAGRLGTREAAALRIEVGKLRRLERQYGRDGLSPGERRYLDRRIDNVARGVPGGF